MLNPLVFAGVDWLIARLERRNAPSPSRAAAPKAIPMTHLTDHTILVGYGRVGNLIGDDLKLKKLPFLVIEVSGSTVSKLKESGIEALTGNAAQPDILKAARLLRKPKRRRCHSGGLRGGADRPASPAPPTPLSGSSRARIPTPRSNIYRDWGRIWSSWASGKSRAG